MDEFIICDVCMEVFDGGLRCPRMFTCGHSFCSSCIQKLLTTSPFCPTCKVPIENESLDTISINHHLKQMVEKYSIKTANEPTGSLVKEEKYEYQMKAANAASSANDLDKIEENLIEHFNYLKEVTEDLKFDKSLMLNNKDKLMASVTAGEIILVLANKDGITRYGELDVKEGIFRIHSMHPTNNSPTSVCITLDNCLTTMTGKKEWPKKIFLQFSANGDPLDDVIIRLQESSKEATKTVLYSWLFGEEGKTFIGVELFERGFYGEFICSEGCFLVPSDVDGEALLKEKMKKNWDAGEMGLALWNRKNGMEFKFWIFGNGSNVEFDMIPTGQVEKGIEVIKDAYRRWDRGEDIKVLNCGWVLN